MREEVSGDRGIVASKKNQPTDSFVALAELNRGDEIAIQVDNTNQLLALKQVHVCCP